MGAPPPSLRLQPRARDPSISLVSVPSSALPVQTRVGVPSPEYAEPDSSVMPHPLRRSRYRNPRRWLGAVGRAWEYI